MPSSWPHLIAAPILLPLLTAAVLLLMGEGRRSVKGAINVAVCALVLLIAVALAWHANHAEGAQAIGVYLPGNWPVPYGIVLVADRLSALMLTLTAALALAASIYATARWHRAGVHFHALFQLQLMGLNGAFLTGDLFNLFVFFEIMLTASYGLLLHGSGWPRVRAGLHVIAINLMASTLFLIGAALLYGVTGTLNLADMAVAAAAIAPADRGLRHAGAAILAVAFLAKAGAWPLAFWLPGAYASAAAPIAALFAVMTKLGVYALLRVWTLLFSVGSGASGSFGSPVITGIGLATLAFGAVGMLATRNLARMAAFGVIVSSGTLLAAMGLRRAPITGAALYYAAASTLALGALFLLIELIDRARQAGESPQLVSEALPSAPGRAGRGNMAFQTFAYEAETVRAAPPVPGVNLDDAGQALTGRAIPAAMAFLGLTFIACGLTLAGLPPLAGFVGKFSMLSALLATRTMPTAGWLFFALLLAGGLLAMIAVARAGIRSFWTPRAQPPRLLLAETLPIVLLVALLLLLTVFAGPALRYTQAAARALYAPRNYISAVIMTRPRPAPGAAGQQGAP
ncbi:MAG: monovalent cation/H+ antiporter subunit D [Burkholderiaceae bacterium]|jgi:multicomponent K+:H+ antiporter subunit D|nr:monovalent cation/H+ antiporter subunit D [Burkholderiaceae bacterium]